MRREALIGIPISFLIAEPDRDSLAADLAAMHRATDSRARSLEARIVGPQRVLTQVALTVAASRGSAGQPTELHWLLIDVTGQKRTEEALQVAEEKFRTIFEGSLDAVAIIRMADGTFADVNAECSRFTGFSRADMIGKTQAELGIWLNEDELAAVVGELQSRGFVRNLETGSEVNLTSSAEASPLISPDGRKIAYSVWENNQNPIYVIDLDGGSPHRVCEDCGNAVSWSPDGAKILYLAGHPSAIYALDMASGGKSPFLSKPGSPLDQAQISPDGRAVAFVVRMSADQSQIVVAPLQGGIAVPPNQWITAVASPGWNDKPRWSADGRTIYFYSTRDSFPCIWRQRLDPANLRPVDRPLVVLDLHDPEFSLKQVSRGAFNLSVAHNLMVLNIATSKANIWETSVP